MADRRPKTANRGARASGRGAGDGGEAVPPETGAEAPEPATPGIDTPPKPSPEPSPDPAPSEPRPADRARAAPLDAPPHSDPDPLPPPYSDPAPEPQPDAAGDEPEDDAGPSFAGRALAGLILLLLGAGIGIWLAPKLAAQLPSGLAPVAAWLTPGQTATETRVAAIRQELDAELAALSDQIAAQAATPDEGATVEATVDQAVAGVESRLAEEINTLRDQIAAQGGGEDFRQRLAGLESTLQGQTAELDDLQGQITGDTAASGAANEATAQRIDVYRAELEGLRGEFDALSGQVALLENRIGEVAASAERRVADAEDRADQAEAQAAQQLSGAEIQSELTRMRAALASGQPFAEPLSRLAEAPQITVPEPLADLAESGVATLPELRAGFADAAHDAIRAGIGSASAGEGFLARSRAYLEAQVASRSLTPQPGLDTDAVLSRMEEALRNDDLQAALNEAENLPDEARNAMSSWIGTAQQRLGAMQALETLASAAPGAPAAPATTN